jgi:hypothetical protein
MAGGHDEYARHDVCDERVLEGRQRPCTQWRPVLEEPDSSGSWRLHGAQRAYVFEHDEKGKLVCVLAVTGQSYEADVIAHEVGSIKPHRWSKQLESNPFGETI